MTDYSPAPNPFPSEPSPYWCRLRDYAWVISLLWLIELSDNIIFGNNLEQPLSPPSAPAQRRLQSTPAKRKFLGVPTTDSPLSGFGDRAKAESGFGIHWWRNCLREFQFHGSGFVHTLISNQLCGFELPLILNDDKRRLNETAPSR